jgi:TonB family protein
MRVVVLAAVLALQVLQATKPAPLTEAPKPIFPRPYPEYTEEAIKANYHGKARASGTVDVEGRLINVVLLSPLPYGMGDQVIECLQNWRFVPAKRDGEPISVPVNIEIGLRPLQK